FKKHSAICFETQEVPNLYFNPSFIDENKAYERYTKFIFN
ncbi:MAG: galactose mutarotase, partial [Fusobacterium periodonticum]|nr:galactose mutarotase [Fusobacterium periodonticum]